MQMLQQKLTSCIESTADSEEVRRVCVCVCARVCVRACVCVCVCVGGGGVALAGSVESSVGSKVHCMGNFEKLDKFGKPYLR